MHLPKIMDLTLVKAQLYVSTDYYSAIDVCNAFLLIGDKKSSMITEYELDKVKESLNKCKWEDLDLNSSNFVVMAQLMLDFMEGLSTPIIDRKGLEVLREI